MKISLSLANNQIITVNIDLIIIDLALLFLIVLICFWMRNQKQLVQRSKKSQEKFADQLITVSTNMLSGIAIGFLILPLTPLFNSIFDPNVLPMLSSDKAVILKYKNGLLFLGIYVLAVLFIGLVRKSGFDIYDRLEKEDKNKLKFSSKRKK